MPTGAGNQNPKLSQKGPGGLVGSRLESRPDGGGRAVSACDRESAVAASVRPQRAPAGTAPAS